jgi:hypothetical protein
MGARFSIPLVWPTCVSPRNRPKKGYQNTLNGSNIKMPCLFRNKSKHLILESKHLIVEGKTPYLRKTPDNRKLPDLREHRVLAVSDICSKIRRFSQKHLILEGKRTLQKQGHQHLCWGSCNHAPHVPTQLQTSTPDRVQTELGSGLPRTSTYCIIGLDGLKLNT